jgi:signal transduction histidine kinase/ActR/RegA family two-component response regulator
VTELPHLARGGHTAWPARARRIGVGATVAVAYWLAAQIGFGFAFLAEQVTTVWAPTGIGLAALLLWGPSLWPAVWIGAFAANATSEAPLWTAAAVATGNTLEAVAGTWALRRLPRFDWRLRRINDAAAYILLAAGAATTISATIGVGTLCAAGVQPWDRFGGLWRAWWLGDAVGALIVAPVILTAGGHARRSPREWAESGLLVGGTILVTQLVFGWTSGAAHHPLEYVIFPLVIAAAMRGGQPLTALVVLSASAVTIGHTVRGAGPFASDEIHEGLILLQVFMGVLAGTGLLLAAAIAERETGERRRVAAARVGEVLASAENLQAAAPAVLPAICQALEWQVGALWLVDPQDRHLRCFDVWTAPGLAAPAFVARTRELAFLPGVGLPGRVWASRQPAWIVNVVADTNFPRAAVASDAGLHGAFGFPILLGDEVLGAIEFFNRRIVPPDPDLLLTMSTVGHQVGQFIGRKREEAAARQAEREREQLLEREATARSEAETANRVKDEFLATLSHELRTPLNAIVGWTRVLLEGALDDDSRRHALEVVERNAHLQSRLVGDILDVSRIVTGEVRLDVRTVELGAVIGAALDAVRPAADARHVQLRARLGTSPRLIRGDQQRLQQVVWNLLSNAVQFTDAGGTVEVELVDAGDRRMQIRVHDDGAGIDPAFLPHVFERFRQGDGSASRAHGGLGLGLSIVRHLVELHGGNVRAYSAGLGMGSVFTVELPRADPAIDSQSPDAGAARVVASGTTPAGILAGHRILIVDDHHDTRELVETVLKMAGATVDSAGSVTQALEKLDVARPDVLLSDIAMPDADGYSLIQEVRRRDSESGQHLPAAALTAYAGGVDRERALAAGFDLHLAKPISHDELVTAVLDLCERRQRSL